MKPEEQTEGDQQSAGMIAPGPVEGEILPALLAEFGGRVTQLPPSFDIPVLQVEPATLADVAARLKERGFNMCLDVGGVDYHPRTPRFEVVYHFLGIPQGWRVRLRVPVGGDDPQVPTISHLWPAANWAEREVYDLFGVRFEGHPNLKRIVLPQDWEGFPLRKDYPLRGPRAFEEANAPAGTRWDPLGARLTPNKTRRVAAQGQGKQG